MPCQFCRTLSSLWLYNLLQNTLWKCAYLGQVVTDERTGSSVCRGASASPVWDTVKVRYQRNKNVSSVVWETVSHISQLLNTTVPSQEAWPAQLHLWHQKQESWGRSWDIFRLSLWPPKEVFWAKPCCFPDHNQIICGFARTYSAA